ncbi:unnamed protein product [Cylicocyclus nassatus]|uniref:CWH43-like N-terminal domain-containing protein n=1 Tax=Cylicocyclus nassatus TaxID=53992 RepID=A0AA36H1J3_CYLNA|nr:unnamed protein product [Cylicocyclus nassatus]
MILRHIWLMPVLSVAFTLAGMFSGYIIGIISKHYPPLLPLISDGGAYEPEAAVFGQLLNIASFLYIITVYVIHLQIFEYYGHYQKFKRTKWWYGSQVLMYTGYTSAFGLMLVANFRYTEIGTVHQIGALLGFFTMVLYGWGHVIFAYTVNPRLISLLLCHFRLLIMIVTTGCLIVQNVAGYSNIFDAKGAGAFPGFNKIDRSQQSPFYKRLIAATTTEWGMVLAMQLFILTFVAELRMIHIQAPRVIIVRDRKDGEIG